MREYFTYGSVRGVARKGHPYRDHLTAGVFSQREVELRSEPVPLFQLGLPFE